MPEGRAYHASGQGTSEVAIRASMSEDIYIVFAGYSNTGENPMLQVYINPLVNGVWAGGIVFVLGALWSMWPTPRDRRLAELDRRALGYLQEEDIPVEEVI